MVDPRWQREKDRHAPSSLQAPLLLQAANFTSTQGYNVNYKYETRLRDDRPNNPELSITENSFPRAKSADTAFQVIHRYRSRVLDDLEPGRTRQEACKIIQALHLAAFPVFRRRILAVASMHRNLQRLSESQP